MDGIDGKGKEQVGCRSRNFFSERTWRCGGCWDAARHADAGRGDAVTGARSASRGRGVALGARATRRLIAAWTSGGPADRALAALTRVPAGVWAVFRQRF